MKVDTWGYEIISSKHLVGNCVINGRHSMVREREALHCSHTQRQMYRQKETDGKTSLFYVWCAGIHFTFSPHHHRTPASLSRAHTHKRAHAHSLSVCLSLSLSLSHTHTHIFTQLTNHNRNRIRGCWAGILPCRSPGATCPPCGWSTQLPSSYPPGWRCSAEGRWVGVAR